MKKYDLLIGLGDSWAAGDGCWEPELYNDETKDNWADVFEFKKTCEAADYTATHNWIYELSNLLECDKVNLGQGGSSNEMAVFRFQNYLKTHDSSKTSLLIFVVTSPWRFGVYRNTKWGNYTDGYLPDQHFWFNTSEYEKDFYNFYNMTMNSQEEDPFSRNVFTLYTLQCLCEMHNIDFRYCYGFTNMREYYDSNKYMNLVDSRNDLLPFKYESMFDMLLKTNESKLFAHDYHPNLFGHQFIAQYFFNRL